MDIDGKITVLRKVQRMLQTHAPATVQFTDVELDYARELLVCDIETQLNTPIADILADHLPDSVDADIVAGVH